MYDAHVPCVWAGPQYPRKPQHTTKATMGLLSVCASSVSTTEQWHITLDITSLTLRLLCYLQSSPLIPKNIKDLIVTSELNDPPREELRRVRSFSITPRKSQALKDVTHHTSRLAAGFFRHEARSLGETKRRGFVERLRTIRMTGETLEQRWT